MPASTPLIKLLDFLELVGPSIIDGLVAFFFLRKIENKRKIK